MSEKAKRALKVIVEAAGRAGDELVMSVEIPVENSDERREVCEELVRYGCIRSVVYLGWNRVQCRITPIAFSYLDD